MADASSIWQFWDVQLRGGVCRPATVKGVGEFFLQRRAITGHIYVEFNRLLPSTFAEAEIKLFR